VQAGTVRYPGRWRGSSSRATAGFRGAASLPGGGVAAFPVFLSARAGAAGVPSVLGPRQGGKDLEGPERPGDPGRGEVREGARTSA